MAFINNQIELTRAWLHEFRHLRQYHRSFLKSSGKFKIWKGKRYSISSEQRKKEYNSPWEKDARRAERDFKEFLVYFNSFKMYQRMFLIAIKDYMLLHNIKLKDKLLDIDP